MKTLFSHQLEISFKSACKSSQSDIVFIFKSSAKIWNENYIWAYIVFKKDEQQWSKVGALRNSWWLWIGNVYPFHWPYCHLRLKYDWMRFKNESWSNGRTFSSSTKWLIRSKGFYKWTRLASRDSKRSIYFSYNHAECVIFRYEWIQLVVYTCTKNFAEITEWSDGSEVLYFDTIACFVLRDDFGSFTLFGEGYCFNDEVEYVIQVNGQHRSAIFNEETWHRDHAHIGFKFSY